jgi:cell division protein FtsB
MKTLGKILEVSVNRYVITFVIFALWIFVFGPSRLTIQWDLSNKLEKVQSEKQFYLDEIAKNVKASEELLTNDDNLERYAREKYWMKRDNEDVYLVIRKGK